MTTFRVAGTATAKPGDTIVGPFDFDALIDADTLSEAIDLGLAHGRAHIKNAVDVQTTGVVQLDVYQHQQVQQAAAAAGGQ
jgi:hypothetical protein